MEDPGLRHAAIYFCNFGAKLVSPTAHHQVHVLTDAYGVLQYGGEG